MGCLPCDWLYFLQDIEGQKGDEEADEEADGEVNIDDNEEAMDTHGEIQKMSTAMCWMMILCQFMKSYMTDSVYKTRKCYIYCATCER